MDLNVAAIAQTHPVGTLDLNQVLPGASIVHVAPVGVQTISHVIRTEVHPHSFFVSVHVPVRLPGVLGAGIDAAILVAGVGVDSQPLAMFLKVIIIIFLHGIRCCSRDCLYWWHNCFFRRPHLLPLLLLATKPVEVVQIRLGIPKKLPKGIVVKSVVHQVLDGPHPLYFGIDDVVLQLEL